MKKLSIFLSAVFMFVASQATAGECCPAKNDRNVCCDKEYENSTCPTICYVPCVKYEPQYYCCPRTECYYVTKQKKCTRYRDECYQVRRCKMVPQYYYENCTRKVPECYYEPYQVKCEKKVYDKYCKMVPRCYYRKVVTNGCNTCGDQNGNGNGNGSDNALGLQPAPAQPDLAPRKVAEGLSSPDTRG